MSNVVKADLSDYAKREELQYYATQEQLDTKADKTDLSNYVNATVKTYWTDSDLDNIKNLGEFPIYQNGTVLNFPSVQGEQGVLKVFYGFNNQYLIQMFFCGRYSNDIYIRKFYNSTWSGWNKIAVESDTKFKSGDTWGHAQGSLLVFLGVPSANKCYVTIPLPKSAKGLRASLSLTGSDTVYIGNQSIDVTNSTVSEVYIVDDYFVRFSISGTFPSTNYKVATFTGYFSVTFS